MDNEITNISQYNSVGATLLAKYGKDINGNRKLEASELNDSLTQGEYRKIAKAGNDDPSTISYLDVLTYEGYKISKAVQEEIIGSLIIPEMVDIPGNSFRIMRDEVTVSLFKAVMQEYEITGYNADKLQVILDSPSQIGNALTYVSLNDAKEFAKRLSAKTGRKFRVPTAPEWEAANKLIANQLSGNNDTWTETLKSDGTYKILSRIQPIARSFYPVARESYVAFRLVEDK